MAQKEISSVGDYYIRVLVAVRGNSLTPLRNDVHFTR